MTPNHDTIELPVPDGARPPVALVGAGAPMLDEQVSAWVGTNKVLDQVDLSMPR